MSNNELMRRDVAIEIIAEMIADGSIKLSKEKEEKKIQELKENNKIFKEQREKIYLGDKETINYVIDVYGSCLKEQR